MKRKLNTAILLTATIFSDWSLLLLLLYLSFVCLNCSLQIKTKELLYFVLFILIATIYSYLGFLKTEPVYVIKNSLIFWLLPTLFLIKGYNVPIKDLNIAIAALYVQCFLVITLYLFGVDIFYREGIFSYLLGYYSGGGTVVLFRFYSYKLVLLMSLLIIRSMYYKFPAERTSLGLLIAVIISGSKALALSLVTSLLSLISKASGQRKITLFIFITIVVTGVSSIYPVIPMITAVFNPNDVSNETRINVYQALMLNPTSLIMGNGFGYPLPTALVRDPTRPYGFEISYISYFHKIGLSLLFVAWALTKKLGFKGMLALIPVWLAALGNPTLSHLYNLFLFSIIIGLRK